VVDMVFVCGQYRLAVADIIVADMVFGRYGRTPSNSLTGMSADSITRVAH